MVFVLFAAVFVAHKRILHSEAGIMKTYLDVSFHQAEKQLMLCQSFIELTKVRLFMPIVH